MNERFIFYWLYLVILIAFFFGAYFIENLGIQYVSEGGNPIFKIHLYSYMVIVLFVFLILRIGLSQLINRLHEFKKNWILSVLSIALVILYGIFRFGTSGLAYLIDTIFVAILIFPIVLLLRQEYRDKLVELLAWLVLINSIIAILEFVLGKGLMQVEFSSFSYFRSTAFLAHPLNNALITASLSPVLMNKTKVPTIIYFAIAFVSLFAFGGRAAMGIFLLGTMVLGMSGIRGFISGIGVNYTRFAIGQMLFFIAVILLSYIVFSTSIGDRILSKLYLDNSAQARFDVFVLLEQLTFKELILGASESLRSSITYYIGIKIIENYILGWLISFGVVGMVLLILAVTSIPITKLIKSDLPIRVIISSFFVISITNNALTAKTPALLILFIVLACVRSKNDFIQIR